MYFAQMNIFREIKSRVVGIQFEFCNDSQHLHLASVRFVENVTKAKLAAATRLNLTTFPLFKDSVIIVAMANNRAFTRKRFGGYQS